MELSLLQKQCKIITFTIGRWSTISTAEHCMFTCWITGNTHITKLKEFLKTNNGIILYWRAWTIIPRPGWVSAIHLMNPHRNNEELHNEASCNSQKDEGFFFLPTSDLCIVFWKTHQEKIIEKRNTTFFSFYLPHSRAPSLKWQDKMSMYVSGGKKNCVCDVVL